MPAADLAGRPDLIERDFTADAPVPDVRTRVKAPGHDGVRERAFGSLNYERLYCEQNDDALDLVRQAVFVSSASGTARVRPQRQGAVGRVGVGGPGAQRRSADGAPLSTSSPLDRVAVLQLVKG